MGSNTLLRKHDDIERVSLPWTYIPSTENKKAGSCFFIYTVSGNGINLCSAGNFGQSVISCV